MILLHEDSLSLSMFWAGMLMVFAPILSAGAVLGFWWNWRKKEAAAAKAKSETPAK
jgi:hypothetical protein